MKTEQTPSAKSQATQRAMMETQPEAARRWQLVNTKTGKVYGPFTTIEGARRAREKRDAEYGGYAHSVREIL